MTFYMLEAVSNPGGRGRSSRNGSDAARLCGPDAASPSPISSAAGPTKARNESPQPRHVRPLDKNALHCRRTAVHLLRQFIQNDLPRLNVSGESPSGAGRSQRGRSVFFGLMIRVIGLTCCSPPAIRRPRNRTLQNRARTAAAASIVLLFSHDEHLRGDDLSSTRRFVDQETLF